jgi:transposase-like protein
MDRQAVLQALEQRIAAGGGALVAPVAELARDLGIPAQRLYYLIQVLAQSGQLWTRSRGPKGLEIRRGEAPGPTEPGRGSRSRFCPWCGHAAEPVCGKRLPPA